MPAHVLRFLSVLLLVSLSPFLGKLFSGSGIRMSWKRIFPENSLYLVLGETFSKQVEISVHSLTHRRPGAFSHVRTDRVQGAVSMVCYQYLGNEGKVVRDAHDYDILGNH